MLSKSPIFTVWLAPRIGTDVGFAAQRHAALLRHPNLQVAVERDERHVLRLGSIDPDWFVRHRRVRQLVAVGEADIEFLFAGAFVVWDVAVLIQRPITCL